MKEWVTTSMKQQSLQMNTKKKYGLRKLSIGVCSVILGSIALLNVNPVAQADTTTNDKQAVQQTSHNTQADSPSDEQTNKTQLQTQAVAESVTAEQKKKHTAANLPSNGNMTNEGKIDRRTWNKITVYKQNDTSDGTASMGSNAILGTINLVKDEQTGLWKAINVNSLGNIDTTDAQTVLINDENGQELSINDIDPNKLPSPYLLVTSELNGENSWVTQIDGSKKYSVQDFNDKAQKNPLIVKDDEDTSVNYEFQGSYQLKFVTKMPHDLIINNTNPGSEQISATGVGSYIPSDISNKEDYFNKLIHVGSYNTIENGESVEHQIYLPCYTGNSVSSLMDPSSETGEMTDPVKLIKQIKEKIAHLPANVSEEDANDLSNDLMNAGFLTYDSKPQYDPDSTEASFADSGYTISLVPEYDQAGEIIKGKYAGRLWIKANTDFQNNKTNINIQFENLDPEYKGYLGNIYGYTGGGSGSAGHGTLVIPIKREISSSAEIHYIDDDTNTELKQNTAGGKTGETINFENPTVAKQIQDFEHEDYELVRNDFDPSYVFQIDPKDNVFYVHLKKKANPGQGGDNPGGDQPTDKPSAPQDPGDRTPTTQPDTEQPGKSEGTPQNYIKQETEHKDVKNVDRQINQTKPSYAKTVVKTANNTQSTSSNKAPKSATLPQTGEASSSKLTIIGLISSLIGLLTFAGFKRRKEQ
jgi:LPXTG-motif cell wall-anchored protein